MSKPTSASHEPWTEHPPLLLDGNNLTLEQIESVALRRIFVALAPAAVEQMRRSRSTIESILKENRVVYGVTTGFGKFKDTYIPPADSRALQRNFLFSHAAGTGAALDVPSVRAMMVLRANALAKGFSGIRPEVVTLLLDCLNDQIHPLVPEQGSLGASGDLAPLAHLSLVLIGEGMAEVDGEILPGSQALARRMLSPVALEAKEGLALTNGTQAMAAIGTLTLLEAERLAKLADLIGALSLEAQLGSSRPFLKEIHSARPQSGQLISAANIARLLQDSALVESHRHCSMVQDAYSLRCMAQVHGASRQAFAHTREVLEIEANSATDNPLIFGDEVVSGGNFHGQPLALVMDYTGIALAELANISERRTERLVNPALSNGLPAFLTAFGGLNSGFMVAHYTAAALVSENKSLAHPASVDSIPTSANQEDHVSMGMIAARKARAIMRNTRKVLAIEMLCATQGLDFRIGTHLTDGERDAVSRHSSVCTVRGDQPIFPGRGLKAAYELIRQHVRHLVQDREMHLDIAEAEQLIASGQLLAAVEAAIGPLA